MDLFSNILKKDAIESLKNVRQKISDSLAELNDGSPDNRDTELNNGFYIPPLQGDYAKAVFLWAFSKPSPVKRKDDYARYFLFECGIRDCIQYHKALIEEGMLKIATPKEQLSVFKVPELKDMLKELGEPVSGKKADLIKRLLICADEEFLESHCPYEVYILSDMGLNFLNAHEDYIQLHKHSGWSISWQEYDQSFNPEYDFLTNIMFILHNRLKTASLLESRNTYYMMYSVLMEQGKRADALETLLKVCYLDVNGAQLISEMDLYKHGMYSKKELKEHFEYVIYLPQGFVTRLREFKNVYDPDMIDLLYTWKFPFKICDKRLFQEIVESAITGSFDEESVFEELKQAYYKFVNKL